MPREMVLVEGFLHVTMEASFYLAVSVWGLANADLSTAYPGLSVAPKAARVSS